MARGETYDEFVAKFERKKTTDDCYTPSPVYEALHDWALTRWPDLITPERVKRPFWPDGDYEADAETYTAGDVVIDNPPFSILAQVRKFYQARRIPYILFAPAMTCISHAAGDSAIITNSNIVFENGANVRCNFVTNLPAPRIFTAPDLARAMEAAAREASPRKELPRNVYPPEVVDVARLQMAVRLGMRVELDDGDLIPASNLDALRTQGRSHFGAFYLCRRDVAEELAARIEAARIEAARIEAARIEAARIEAARIAKADITHPLSEREHNAVTAITPSANG